MKPFPEIDEFEIRQAHPAKARLEPVFRCRLIFCKFRLPRRFAQRGQDPRGNFPFGDRQPALGEPGDPAHQHNHNHKRRGQLKPARDRQWTRTDGRLVGLGRGGLGYTCHNFLPCAPPRALASAFHEKPRCKNRSLAPRASRTMAFVL